MTPNWKLTVEGLGKIERAEVDIRPLTLFVGPNNSGKSYLASLIWGIVAMHGGLEIPEGTERDAVDAVLKDRLARGWDDELTEEEVDTFRRAFQTTLRSNQSTLMQSVFRNRDLNVGRIDFVATGEQARRKLPKTLVKVIANIQQASSDHLARIRGMLIAWFGAGPFGRSAPFYNDSWSALDPIYMPASRTGFMQLYKAAARRGLREAFSGAEERWLDMTTPAFHFIDMLTFGFGGQGHGAYFDESNLLQQCIHGKVELVRGGVGVNDYRFMPTGTSLSLPMGLSSSLVTELAPLILVLRHLDNFPLLILEEPEAHLHPELQRRVAQVIVRLIRKGLFVLITTHSPDFCQQINNFMKLGALSEDKRAEAQKTLGYESQDYLTQQDVSGYEFKLDSTGEHTSVVELKKKPSGLSMPSFNTSLINLSDEVAQLEDLLNAQEDANG